jgi:hypothetical protein
MEYIEYTQERTISITAESFKVAVLKKVSVTVSEKGPALRVTKAVADYYYLHIGDPIRYFVTRAKTSKTSQFAVIRRSTGIESHTSETYYRSFKVATSCVNRYAGWICHIRLSR